MTLRTVVPSSRIWWAILLVLALGGCAAKVGPATLPGTWQASYAPYGMAKLTLNANSTYTLRLVSRAGKRFEKKGRWDLSRGSPDAVTLHDPVDVETTFRTGRLQWSRGSWGLNVLKSLGPVYLEINDDLEQRFSKISDAQDPPGAPANGAASSSRARGMNAPAQARRQQKQ
jgi:hypothetical protein